MSLEITVRDTLILIIIITKNIIFENSSERGMGAENQYSHTVELYCKVCGKSFEQHGDIGQYPDGCINQIY